MLNSLLISVGAIVGIVVVALVIILVIAVVVWWIKTANALVRLNNKAEEAWAVKKCSVSSGFSCKISAISVIIAKSCGIAVPFLILLK